MGTLLSFGNTHRVVGTWKHRDGLSEREFTFALRDGHVEVAVVDTGDGERPEVMAVEWLEHELSLRFAAHWSNGRLVKYCVQLSPDNNRGLVTMTTTFQELWERR
jgi:hypothetical protein